jgi:hypothetical protein
MFGKKKKLYVSSVQFEFTGKELKDHFQKRIDDLEVKIQDGSGNGKDGNKILYPTKFIDHMKRKQTFYKTAFDHINANYVYHLSGDDMKAYELVDTEESLLS